MKRPRLFSLFVDQRVRSRVALRVCFGASSEDVLLIPVGWQFLPIRERPFRLQSATEWISQMENGSQTRSRLKVGLVGDGFRI